MLVGIIVSFQPDVEKFIVQINNLIDQLDLIIIVENGSDEITQNQIKNLSNHRKVKILITKENEGLAAAQNKGINKGIELGADYFLFLDDDSSLSEGSVKLLTKEFENNVKVGIVACHILHKDSNKIQKYWIKTKYLYKRVSFSKGTRKLENVNTVISSGSLISKKVIKECGLMREEYFIDYIDIEYCMRVRANGYSISVIRSAELLHRLGNTKSIRIGNTFVHPTYHNPSRRFYMIRNRIWTWKLYTFSFPGWFLIDIGNFAIDNIRVFLFEKNRLENFRQFFYGLKEGFLREVKKN